MDETRQGRRAAWKVVLAAVGVLFGVVSAQVLAVLLVVFLDLPSDSLWAALIPEAFGAVSALLAMALLGGAAWLSTSRDDLLTMARLGWWCLATSVGVMVLALAGGLADGSELSGQWPWRTLELALFCLAVGVFEEALFRGVILGTILAVWGGTRAGVVGSVLATSLLFGLAHVDFGVALTDTLTLVQAALKVLQTGMYSFLLCVVVLKTHRLGAASLFHALDDFAILFPSVALFDEGLSVKYVTTGSDGALAAGYYLLTIALYVPFVVVAARELRRGRIVYRGPFMEHALSAEDTSAPRRPAPPVPPGGGAPRRRPPAPSGLEPPS